MREKILAIVLALVLVAALLPVVALAADNGTVAYPVTGGNIYFDPATGTVTGSDENVIAVDIPSAIDGKAVTGVGDYAFYNRKSLASVILPESVASIGEYAFGYCPLLSELTLPNSLTYLGDAAFQGTGLTAIAIPASVTEIEGNPFAVCPKLRQLTVADSNPGFTAENGVLYNKDKTELIAYPSGSGPFVIPDSVKVIGPWAFQETNLTDVVIPVSVTSIGEGAFYDCADLEDRLDIYYGGDSDQWDSIKVGDDAFKGSNGGYSSSTHWNTGLDDILSEYGYEYDRFFHEFTGEPYPVTGGFIYFDSDTGAITGADGGIVAADIPVEINGKAVTSIGDDAFNCCFRLTSVMIPEGVTSIGKRAFYRSRLTSVTIPNSVTSIGEEAFSCCYGLTNVVIPEGVTRIEGHVFDYCSSLKSVTIPSSVTYIYMWKGSMFGVVESLTDIYYTGSEAQWRSFMEGMEKDPDYTYEWLELDPKKVTIHYDSVSKPSIIFTDVPAGAWYRDALNYVLANTTGVINGTDATHFSPNANLTRAAFAKILWAIEGSEPATTDNPFTDVKAGEWYYDAVIWANAEGIMLGDAGRCKPEDNITREEMAVMIQRWLNGKAATTESKFTDAKDIHDWAAGAVNWAAEQGYIKGKDNGTFAPLATLTRAEMIVVVARTQGWNG